MVIIKGQRDSVDRAAAMINELIAGEPGSASAIIAKVCARGRRCVWGFVFFQGFVWGWFFLQGFPPPRGEEVAARPPSGACRTQAAVELSTLKLTTDPVLLLLLRLLHPAVSCFPPYSTASASM